MLAVYSILLLLPGVDPKIETRCEQVFPLSSNPAKVERSPGQTRAVILLPGLKLHPLHARQVNEAEFHAWQSPDGPMVREMGRVADVFAFGYSQNTDLEAIAHAPGLEQVVNKLRFVGYRDIVLVGHSAGGILARLFVEDHPHSAVTRVLQIGTPNLGSTWAQADISVRKLQEKFLQSLTPAQRRASVQARWDRGIPRNVDFVCVVVGTGSLGDGLVSALSQWPDDLQAQGIPMFHLPGAHFTVMHSRRSAAVLSELARTDTARWTHDEVEKARKNHLPGASTFRFLPTKK